MTEFWVSQKNFWCEYCKVWLKDTVSSRATHENGIKHKENVAKKLREMRHKGDAEKKEKELMARTWKGIEEKAKRQYEEDLRSGAVAKAAPKAAAVTATQSLAHARAPTGAASKIGATGNAAWVLDKDSGYLYNEALRWYYDKATKFYYGGNPPEWTQAPPIPDEAKYREGEAATSGVAKATENVSLSSVTTKKYSHPLQNVGGVQFHQVGGKVGAARGLGAQGKEAAKRKQPETAGGAKPKAKVSKEEAEALAKREAARARTEKRTMKQFGLI